MAGRYGRDREPVMLAGSVVLPCGRSMRVMIVDISPSGCRVECEETLPVAATVELDLGGAMANALVRWAYPGEAGLQLLLDG